jgi:hypothetical protein
LGVVLAVAAIISTGSTLVSAIAAQVYHLYSFGFSVLESGCINCITYTCNAVAIHCCVVSTTALLALLNGSQAVLSVLPSCC